MKTGDRVKTQYGPGTIITQEFDKGALSKRFLVKLDDCPEFSKKMHEEQGGFYIHQNELEVTG